MSRAAHIRVDRDEPDGLAPLAGKEFDAVVDVSRHSRVDGLVSASAIESTGCRQHIQRPSGPEEANDRKLFRHARSRSLNLHKFRMIAHIMSATARSSFVWEKNMFHGDASMPGWTKP
jgi:hypothetical protein